MAEDRPHIAARGSAAAEAASRAAGRADQIAMRNDELLARAMRSLDQSATLAEALARHVERRGADARRARRPVGRLPSA